MGYRLEIIPEILPMRRPLFALAALTGVPLVIAWFLSEQVIHPRRRVEDHDLDDFNLPAEEISFNSRDGTRLAGWFILPRDASRPAPGVVLSHGWARSRCELLPHADFLHRAGYAVLMFDYRNRGLSEGESITMGVGNAAICSPLSIRSRRAQKSTRHASVCSACRWAACWRSWPARKTRAYARSSRSVRSPNTP